MMKSRLSQLAPLENISAATNENCMFCGNKRHPRKFRSAKSVTFFKCSKRGHFIKVCRSKSPLGNNGTSVNALIMEIISNAANSKVNVSVFVNGSQANALFDPGSTLSHLSEDFSELLELDLEASDCCVGLAVKGCSSKDLVKCCANVELNGQTYDDVSFTVLNALFTDVILGQDFMNKDQNVNIHLVGPMPTLHLGTLQSVKTFTPIRLFEHLKSDCRPTATKSRKYSRMDSDCISAEVKRLLKESLKEPSNSPWRAQPLVVTQGNHKKRIVIDCSQTVNKYTLLDAYPLPRM